MTEREQQYFDSIYLKCEFDDECENCDNPENGSYAVGYTNDEYGEEVDYYICGKCAEDEDRITLIVQENKVEIWRQCKKGDIYTGRHLFK